MEKLIELLNEYWEYDLVEHNWKICKWTTDDETGEINIYTDYTNNIISKKFRFIQRLVENDKIDFSNLKISELTSWTDLFYSFSETEVLLMLLSISDTPISDLVSYLK